ncbi:flavin reductase family protein [Pseudomonas gingeri]|uniref:flavin reductase family protein n=1 Tax=Pseudomonas gingeri TaxID=117681 RepID=UPI0015A06F73|nr:flavin reductase family protein [Pseudomonas gingeri]NWA29891.1 flavin reductase family protein [Pseudomonas gingeri]
MEIDPDTLDSTETYKILIGSVLPRPIGWASTISADGVANLAPFSFFTVVSRKPPMVSLTIQPRSDRTKLKDTLINARETGEFVINVVSLAQANQMHITSGEHDPETDEFELAGLTTIPSITVRAPRVAGAPITMECKVESILSMGEVGDHLVIGRITRFHIRDDLWLDRGRIDTAALQPVGRLAAEYTLVNSVFACPIPEYVLDNQAHMRMHRIDSKDASWSALDERGWSAAGNAKV